MAKRSPQRSSKRNQEQELEKPKMATKVNFRAAAEREFPVLEPGTYEFKFVKADKKIGQQSGKEYVSLDFQHDEGEDAENPNMHVFNNYSLQAQSLWALRDVLKSLECDEAILNDEEADVEEAIRSVYNNRCAIKLGIEEYDSNDKDETGKPIRKKRNNVLAVMRV